MSGHETQATLPIDLPSREAAHDLDERYTTRETFALCCRLAGVAMFDLDVAACEESHKADLFYTVESNGLEQPWFGRVWANPPYSDIEPWVRKAWAAMADPACSLVAMLLPATRTDQRWWQYYIEGARDEGSSADDVRLTTRFLPGRQRFGLPGNPDGIGMGSPPFGCVLLLWRRART